MRRTSLLRRTAMKARTAPLRRTAMKTQSPTAEAKADALFSRRIRARDRCCRRCGATKHLDAAHVIRRGFHAVRWVEANAVALCRRCHEYMGAHRFEWEVWCVAEGIPFDDLRWRALHDVPERPEDALARLKAAA